MSDKKSLDEKTSISIRLLVVVVAVIIWLVRLSDKVDSQDKSVDELKSKLETCIKDGPRGERQHHAQE